MHTPPTPHHTHLVTMLMTWNLTHKGQACVLQHPRSPCEAGQRRDVRSTCPFWIMDLIKKGLSSQVVFRPSITTRRVHGLTPHRVLCTAASRKQITTGTYNISEVMDPQATLLHSGIEEDLWEPAWGGTLPLLFAELLFLNNMFFLSC